MTAVLQEFIQHAQEGNLSGIQRLLQGGSTAVDVNGRDPHDWTALLWACQNGHTGTAVFLADLSGVDLNVRSSDGNTALYQAGIHNHTAIVQHLLSKGSAAIDVNVRLLHGNTVLHYVCDAGRVGIVHLLLAHPATDATVRNDNGQTAYDLAVQKNHTEIATLLLRRSNDSKDDFSNSLDDALTGPERALLRLAEHGLVKQVEALLYDGDDHCDAAPLNVNAHDSKGRTALHWAAQEGHARVVRCLCNHAAVFVNARDCQGWTPLHWACFRGCGDVVAILLDHRDTDVLARACDGNTPWDVGQAHANIRQCLLPTDNHLGSSGSGSCSHAEQFFSAVRGGRTAEIVHLIHSRRVADVNLPNTHGMTGLHVACRYGHVDIVRVLVQHESVQLGIQDHGGYQRTALHEACRWRNNQAVVNLLLARMTRAQLDLTDAEGRTALQVALAQRNREVVPCFLQCDKVDPHRALQCILQSSSDVQFLQTFMKTTLLGFANVLNQHHGIRPHNEYSIRGQAMMNTASTLSGDRAFARTCLQNAYAESLQAYSSTKQQRSSSSDVVGKEDEVEANDHTQSTAATSTTAIVATATPQTRAYRRRPVFLLLSTFRVSSTSLFGRRRTSVVLWRAHAGQTPAETPKAKQKESTTIRAQ